MTTRSMAAILAAISVTTFAAPVLAESSLCVVKAPEINLRKSPSKKAKVVAVLKKDVRVTAQSCGGGWVKVASRDGHLSGYVGGWALSAEAPKVAAATPAPEPTAAVPVASAKPEPLPVTAPMKEVPSNEKLAYQITELRLNVIGIERDIDKMGKDIQKIKTAMRHKSAAKKVASTNKKAHKLMAQR